MIALLLLACAGGSLGGFRVEAVEYARSAGVEAGRFLHGATGPIALSWSIGVVRQGDRVILVDAGTDALESAPEGEQAKRWGVQQGWTVPEALARVGLSPGEVTDVVLTHEHWDHSDGLVHFPQARIWTPEATWRRLRRSARDDAALGPVLARIEADGRWRAEGAPDGLVIRVEGRHTAAHTTVEVPCPGGPVLFAGDAVVHFEQAIQGLALEMSTDRAAGQREVAAMVARAGDAYRVLPLHDPALYDRYPSEVAGVARICGG